MTSERTSAFGTLKMLSTIAAVAVLTGSVAFAEGDPVLKGPKAEGQTSKEGKGFKGDRGPGKGAAMMDLIKELNLTDEQKTQMRTIMADGKKSMDDWRTANQAELDKINADIKAAHEAKDRDAAQKAHASRMELMKSAPNPESNHAKIRAILTPDQQKTFDEKAAALKKQREENRHKGGPMMEGGRGKGEGKGRPEGKGKSESKKESSDKLEM